ncbi:MAG: hypothetical protein WDO13_07270 [Verrucomicrobiota bacterium]
MKNYVFFACLVLGSVLIVSIVTPLVYIRVIREEERRDRAQILAEHHQQMLNAMAQSQKLMEQINQSGGTIVATPNGFQVQPPPGVPAQAAAPKVALVDAKQDETENNYLARVITQDIVGQALAATNLTDALPSFTFMTQVMTSDPPYAVDVIALGSKEPQVQVEIHPAFAWDGAEYAKAAAVALGGAKASEADPQAGQCLANLLEPTGAKLAKEDVRLSARLQQNPRDAAAHEEAALLLVSLALRENAGDFSDVRTMLCRAAAHLAMADALNGSAAPSWNNRIADAAVRVLAGRQVDAQSALDLLAQDPHAPDAAKSWLAALNIWNKANGADATVTAASPRLVRIAWFQENMRNLPPMVAVAKLEALGQPEEIVDWTRAIMASDQVSVELGNRFCQSSMETEYKELNEILAAEGEAPLDQGHLDTFFSEPEPDTVTVDAGGHAVIHVVGGGTFKAAARRHLFTDIERTEDWLSRMLGAPDEAKSFGGQILGLYSGVPYFELVRSMLGDEDDKVIPVSVNDRLLREGKTWDISALPANQLFWTIGQAPLVLSYFNDGPPFGTTYGVQLPAVIHLLHTNGDWHRESQDNDPMADLKGLFLQRLLAMRPGSLELARAVLDQPGPPVTADRVMEVLGPLLNYNIHAFEYIENHDGRNFTLDDAQRETVWKQRCELDPDAYFAYGDFLWNKGRADEAADAYRKGVAQGNDQVMMANDVGNLVNYDWDHGKKDEAMRIARQAAGVYSKMGLQTYLEVLEKSGDLDGAEQQAIAIRDRYDDPYDLESLYASHPGKFADKAAAMFKGIFPLGAAKVKLASFTGPPATGALIGGDSDQLSAIGLGNGDIIVALNGTRTETANQYYYARAQLTGPEMDLIVWHAGQYVEVKASPPQHRFSVSLEDYSKPSAGP